MARRDAAAKRPFQVDAEDVDASSPLLGRTSGNDHDESAALSKRWTGLDEFDGLPWWRVPSVGNFKYPSPWTFAYRRRYQVYWLLFPYLVFTLAFGGIIVPKLNLCVRSAR